MEHLITLVEIKYLEVLKKKMEGVKKRVIENFQKKWNNVLICASVGVTRRASEDNSELEDSGCGQTASWGPWTQFTGSKSEGPLPAREAYTDTL